MKRRITYEILKKFHKNGINSLSNTGHCSKNISNPASKSNVYSNQKRLCHISNVTTQDDSIAINITKSFDLRSKILHTTVLPMNEADSRNRAKSTNISIHWGDGRHDEYPAVWLRDNCQCPECYNKAARNRMMLMQNLDVDVSPEIVLAKDDKLEVKWSDGHYSQFTSHWLRDRAFRDDGMQYRNLMAKGPKKMLWGKEHIDRIGYHDYEEILREDRAMYDWMNDLSIFGFAIINNMPRNFESLPELLQNIGIEKATHYGKSFKVITKSDPSNAAYTSLALGLHLDMPIYRYKPGLQFLQCIDQYEFSGGENQFTDGFMIEQVMKEKYLEEWKILCETDVVFKDENEDAFGDFNKVRIAPTFDLDDEGIIQSLNYNNQMRSQFLNLPIDKIQPLYNALKLFDDICYDNEYLINLKLKPGQCVVFDNHRVLHGRSGFEMRGDAGKRAYHGGYMDWDEIISKLNVLRIKLNLK